MQFWELVRGILIAGFLLSLLGTLAAWVMVYVEARRGNDTDRR
jgi:cation transporter-like permease